MIKCLQYIINHGKLPLTFQNSLGYKYFEINVINAFQMQARNIAKLIIAQISHKYETN